MIFGADSCLFFADTLEAPSGIHRASQPRCDAPLSRPGETCSENLDLRPGYLLRFPSLIPADSSGVDQPLVSILVVSSRSPTETSAW